MKKSQDITPTTSRNTFQSESLLLSEDDLKKNNITKMSWSINTVQSDEIFPSFLNLSSTSTTTNSKQNEDIYKISDDNNLMTPRVIRKIQTTNNDKKQISSQLEVHSINMNLENNIYELASIDSKHMIPTRNNNTDNTIDSNIINNDSKIINHFDMFAMIEDILSRDEQDMNEEDENDKNDKNNRNGEKDTNIKINTNANSSTITNSMAVTSTPSKIINLIDIQDDMDIITPMFNSNNTKDSNTISIYSQLHNIALTKSEIANKTNDELDTNEDENGNEDNEYDPFAFPSSENNFKNLSEKRTDISQDIKLSNVENITIPIFDRDNISKLYDTISVIQGPIELQGNSKYNSNNIHNISNINDNYSNYLDRDNKISPLRDDSLVDAFTLQDDSPQQFINVADDSTTRKTPRNLNFIMSSPQHIMFDEIYQNTIDGTNCNESFIKHLVIPAQHDTNTWNIAVERSQDQVDSSKNMSKKPTSQELNSFKDMTLYQSQMEHILLHPVMIQEAIQYKETHSILKKQASWNIIYDMFLHLEKKNKIKK